MGWYLAHLNKKQQDRRIALGLPAEIEDTTIMTTAEALAYKEGLIALMAERGMSMEVVNANAFDDMTDFE
jgi:hypothetical protein